MFVAKLESYNQSITVSLCSHPSEKIRVKRVKVSGIWNNLWSD